MHDNSFYTVDTIKQIGNVSPHGFVLINTEHKIVWINKSLEKKGFNLENIRGTIYYKTFNNKTELDHTCATAHAFETKKVETKVEEGEDGKRYAVTAIPIFLNGVVKYVLEIAKENAQKTIRTNDSHNANESAKSTIEAWPQEALTNCFDSIFVTDKDYRITYVNKTFERLSGSSKDAIIGEIPTIFKSKRTDPGIYKEFWKTIYAGEVWEQREVGGDKKSTQYPKEIKIIPVKDELGFIKKYIGIEKDISEENRLFEKLEHVKLFPEQKPDPIIQVNYNGIIEEYAGNTKEVFGELKGNHIRTIFSEDISKKFEQIKETESQHVLDCNVKLPGKEYQITAVDIPKKQLINFYFSDITKMKQAENKLRERNEELEQFYKLAIGRELKMIELKKRIRDLELKVKSKITVEAK